MGRKMALRGRAVRTTWPSIEKWFVIYVTLNPIASASDFIASSLCTCAAAAAAADPSRARPLGINYYR